MIRKLRYLRILLFSFFYTHWLKSIGMKIGKRNLFLGFLDIRGYHKSIKIGNNNVFQKRVCLNTLRNENTSGSIEIKDNCLIADSTIISSASLIEINNNVEIAARCYLVDHDHKTYFTSNKPEKIIIQKNVWIGTGTTVLKDVTIGESSVVGANSLINRNIDSKSLVVGNPMKVVRKG